MATPLPLNNVDHRDMRVSLGHGAAFGDAVNQLAVFPPEFEELQREYPLMLRRVDGGGLRAVALLGFAADENLFLAGGRWDAAYVPALARRGPFSIGTPAGDPDGEPTIHVDPGHPRVALGGEGAPVFLDQGGEAPVLRAAADALRTIYSGSRAAAAAYAAWGQTGLLEEVTLEAEGAGGGRFTVPGAVTVSAERLAALDGEALARLHRDDLLRPAIWLRSSLGNLPRLVARREVLDRAR